MRPAAVCCVATPEVRSCCIGPGRRAGARAALIPAGQASPRFVGCRASPRNGPGISPADPCFDSGPILLRARRVASRNHNLAPARPSHRRGPIFQSITRFGMTGWDGDPTTGSPDLPSPPRGWSPAAGSARKAPSCFVGARYALEIASVQLRRRVPHYTKDEGSSCSLPRNNNGLVFRHGEAPPPCVLLAAVLRGATHPLPKRDLPPPPRPRPFAPKCPEGGGRPPR
jgi:hypothetical protein